MELALIIDKDSVFNTVNFNKILKELENEERVRIVTYIYLKRHFSEDFICSLTDKYEENLKDNKYKVYRLYEDDNVRDFLNNDLFYYDDYKDYEYDELFYYEKKVLKRIIRDFKNNNALYLESKKILNSYKEIDNDFVLTRGKRKVIVSAPHNAPQYLNGVYKRPDFGTGTIAVSLHTDTDCYSIIKTKTVGNVFKNDNANRQVKCKYRSKLKKSIKENNIKALIDIHSMRRNRKQEINIGIDGGNNIFNDDKLLQEIIKIIEKNNFKVSVDKPFRGKYPTIANFVSSELKIIGIQVEINSKFINYNFSSQRYNDVIKMLDEVIIFLDSYKKNY